MAGRTGDILNTDERAGSTLTLEMMMIGLEKLPLLFLSILPFILFSFLIEL